MTEILSVIIVMILLVVLKGINRLGISEDERKDISEVMARELSEYVNYMKKLKKDQERARKEDEKNGKV